MFNKILTNLPSMVAERNLKNANQDFATSVERLASGSQLNQAGDNPSGTALAGLLESELRSGEQAERNAIEASSIFDIAGGALAEISNQLIRVRELAIQASSDTLDDSARDAIQAEAGQSLQGLERIVNTTHYGSRMLLNSGDGGTFTFQLGTNSSNGSRLDFDLSSLDVHSGTLGLSDDVDLTDSDSALSSLGSIDEAIGRVETARATVGAYQSTLESNRVLLAGTNLITSARLSRIRDTDYADEIVRKFSTETRMRAAVAVLAQANIQNGQLLKLLETH